jgi:orotate phosphoribosyltransferase
MKTIAQLLVEHNVVRTNFTDPFTWTSGLRSPIYCDCRELISLTEARETVIQAFVELIKTNNFPDDIIAGTATAGIPWSAFVADRLNKPMLYVRGKPKGHGAGKMVEGRGERGKHILVVEDAVSTGGSSIVSAEALRRELDATVQHILGIFSWSTPASFENAKKANIEFHVLTEFHEITEALLAAGKISEDEKKELERFHDSPADWWQA